MYRTVGIEREHERETVQALAERFGVEIVEAAGSAPEALERRQRDVDVLGKHGELGEARLLVLAQPLDADLDRPGYGAVARARVARVEEHQAAAVERLVDVGERRGKILASLYPIAQRRVRQLEQQRPLAEARCQVAQAAVEAVGQSMRDERQRLVLPHRVDVDTAGADRHRVEHTRRNHAGASRSALDEGTKVGGVPHIVDDHQDVAIDQQVDERGGCRFDAGKPRPLGPTADR